MAANSDLLSQLFLQYLGVGAEELIQKYTSKTFLLQDQDRMIGELKQKEAAGFANVTNIVLQNNIALQSAWPVNLLLKNRVSISALTRSIDNIVKGKFLLCRVISLPLKISAIVVVVDDPEGDLAVRFSLYNFFPPSHKGKLSHLLPIGLIMAVRNPLFKTSGDGGYGLRSDNPGDVTFLSESQCQQLFPNVAWKGQIPKKYRAAFEKGNPKTVDAWRILGNKYFGGKNYAAALNAYTCGLKIDAQSVSLLSNRAAAYLQTSAFGLALTDANDVLKMEPTHVKAIYRKGKALCGLKKYREAWDFVSHISAVDLIVIDREEMIKLKKTIKLSLRQQETGSYDIVSMLKAAVGKSHCQFDYADYTGPVEIQEAPGKGRGLFVTEDVQPGCLLIGSKAFATCLPDDVRPSNDGKKLNIDMAYSNGNVDLTFRSNEPMESYIARFLTLNLESGKEFYKLYAGPELRYLNHELGDDTSIVDPKRIKRICTLNSLEPYITGTTVNAAKGVWLLPSLINHNCFDCNSIWLIIGDFMLIRAFKPIPKGREVLISYIKPDLPYSERMELFTRQRFLCDCRLCTADQKDSKKIHQTRERLLHDFLQLCGGELKCDSSIFKYYVNRIGSFRSSNPELNVYLITPLLKLALSYENQKDHIQAAKTMEKAYNIAKGTALFYMAIDILAAIVVFYLLADRKDPAVKWLDTLREATLLAYGTTFIFDVIGPPNFLSVLKSHGLKL